MAKDYCIVGTGGFGRETLCCLLDVLKNAGQAGDSRIVFTVDDEFFKSSQLNGFEVIPWSKLNAGNFRVAVAIGDPLKRSGIVKRFPIDTQFATIVHPTAVISKWVDIGEGSIITAGCVLTTEIRLGKHAQINLLSTVGHDCVIGDFFTTAPGVNVSGNCRIGNNVYLGTNSAIKDRIQITDSVTVGMGGVVVKDILEPGVYVGNPVKKLAK